MILKKILKYIKNPKLLLFKFDNWGIIRLNDKKYLTLYYETAFEKKINWNDPKTFNEKLQWLKINDRKDIYTTMVDKYEAKKYVSNIIGNQYIIPTLGIYNSWNEIKFDELPDKFVIKCTHDSGGLVIVEDKNKLDFNKAKQKINKSLKTNYYLKGREWPYKNVKPRIIIEQYMTDNKVGELRDYKFFTFNGKVKYFKIDFNRFIKHQANYYNEKAELQEFGEEICPPDFNAKIQMPKNLNLMLELAEKLSHDTTFSRIDFYEINEKVYFGEITLYPASGFGKFTKEKWDLILGECIDLQKKR